MYTQGVNPPGGDHHNGRVYIAQCVSAHLSPIITTSLPEQIVFAAVRMHFIRGQPLQLFFMTQTEEGNFHYLNCILMLIRMFWHMVLEIYLVE